MSKVKTQLVIEGKNDTQKAFAEVNREMSKLSEQMKTTGKLIAGYFSANAITSSVGAVIRTADAYQRMNARLKLATGNQQEFNKASEELRRIADATASPVDSLVTLYGRISRPLKEAGRSQADILKITEAVATSFRVSGATAQEAEGGVIQFAQALGSGALRGEEFNSVADAAPRLMQALADGIGVPVSALKDMAAQGKLTASVVSDALVGQLGKLKGELEALGSTAGDEWQRIINTFQKGIGQADTGPLIDALKDLRETLADQSVQQNLTAIAGALVALAAAGAKTGSEFGDLGKRIGYWAASVAGGVTELDKLEREILDLERSLEGVTLNDLVYSDAELTDKLNKAKARRAELLEDQRGYTEEAKGLHEELESEEAKRLAYQSTWAEKIKEIQGDLTESTKTALSEQVAAEKKAASELEKAKGERLKTEERYKLALAKLQGGGNGEASFSQATALKAGARQALQDGDIETAKTKAQEALKTLEALAEAGENTYGFAGIIKELQAIETKADDKGIEEAREKYDAAHAQLTRLTEMAEGLEQIQISATMSEEAASAAIAQMQALADQLSKELVVPIRPVVNSKGTATGLQPDGSYILHDTSKPPGFATGGQVHGPGTGTSDSILARLSNGEFVMRAEAVRRLGPALLDRLNNGVSLPKFADGGLVDLPGAAPSGQPVVLDLGSLGQYQGSMPADSLGALQKQFRIQAIKSGKTRR